MPDGTRNGLSELLVDQCPDGIVFAGPDGRVALWNEAAERIFGYSSEQALGQSLDIIIPERLRKAHWEGFDKAVQAGVTRHQGAALPTKAMRRDGTIIYVEMSFAVMIGDDGAAVGALAQVRDITERFERERANRRRLRELEQQIRN